VAWASNAGLGGAGVTPERRGPGRLSGSRKRARLLTFVALAGLAGLAIAGAARFGQLAPRSPELIAWFLIACASAALLGIALLAEMRRLERIEAAQAASEHRFRMAVEAARCGIWEWDLSSDQIYMSEVTAALFGWRGGVVPGQQVLDRAAPGHRDDLRDALTNAAIYGDFDVSFRVPPLAGARPVWIDFRGRGFGESPEGGFARIIGVGLDVTEERLARPAPRLPRAVCATPSRAPPRPSCSGIGAAASPCGTAISAISSNWTRACCGPAPHGT
jgi:two-component system cell cycle sensor histidine kinase PleC